NGEVVFQPDPDFTGIATFQYTLIDSHGVATVHIATVEVAPTPLAPVENPDLFSPVQAPTLAPTTLAVTTPAVATPTVTREGNELTANTTTAGGQYFSTVSTFADGGYVISWTDTSYTEKGTNASSSQIRAQIFDKDGHKVGKEFQVNTTVSGGQYRSQI